MNKNIVDLFFEFSYHGLMEDPSTCESLLLTALGHDLADMGLMEQGMILHMLSEFVRKYEQEAFLEEEKVDVLIDILLNHWSEGEVLYTATLGAIYGGLRGVNLFLKRDDISMTLKDIKATVFKSFILRGKLCSDNVKSGTKPEMLLACIPFGMFEPEDLVLVEAVKAIYHMMQSGELDEVSKLYLAWYYVEQGTYSITRDILKNVSKETSLYKLIFKKLESLGQVDEKAIIHRPYGNYNIYEPGHDERFPKIVTTGMPVTLKAVAFPLSESHEVLLECNGDVITGELLEQKYWLFSAGVFEKGEIVQYRFYYKDDTDVTTETFTFEVMEEKCLMSVSAIRAAKERVQLKMDDMSVSFDISDEGILTIDVDKLSETLIEWDTLPNVGKWLFSNQDYALELVLEPFSFTYSKGQNVLIKSCCEDWLKVVRGANDICSFTSTFEMDAEDEKFYGFGERYNALNQKGETPDNFVYNQYKEQGLRTYIPMPFFVSNKGYGIIANTSVYSKFDMGESARSEISIEVEDSKCQLQILPGSIEEVIRRNAGVSGYPEMLPKWAFGPWMSSNNWDSDKEVRDQVAMTNELDIPATVLVIEAWSDEATFYIFNDAKYQEKVGSEHFAYADFEFPKWGRWPDPKGLVEHLHDNHLKCILWQIPIIKQISSLHHLQKDKDEAHFIKSGYGILNEDGLPFRMPEGWFKDSLLMDFSNEEGHKWWFQKRQYLIDDLKVDGFKTDGGEFVFGKNLKFSDGRTGKEMRNEYPNDYIGAYYGFAKQNDGITFSRAGYRGVNKFPAHWAGDERSTFDAFKRSILAGLSSGISGLPFWGWDLAGFSGDVPTAELFIRSTQMATFCPIMQYHAESKGEFNQDRTPWNISYRSGDKRAISLYRYFANLRMNFIPYIYREAQKSTLTGLPLMKAMVVAFEDDQETHELWDQYLFGDNLLVAPVINEGAVERNVYFPKGKWTNLFTGEILTGPVKKLVRADLEEIPVYVKENAVIPINLNAQFELGGNISNRIDVYDKLCFWIFGVPEGRFNFKDDLGTEISFEVTLRENLEITAVSNVKSMYLLVSKDIETIEVNGKQYETRLLTIEKHDIRMVEIIF